MTPPIAILGAGPSGLTLARLLEMKKIDYIVFERDASSSARDSGGTLDLHTGTGLLAIETAGLFDEFQSKARYEGQAMTALDSQGNVLHSDTADGETGRPEIDRKVLRRLLLDSVPETRVRWGHKVESVYRDDDGSMAISFSDGQVEKGFELVVGADGAWSKARNMITSAKPHYSGISYLQTSIHPTDPIHPRACAQCGEGMYMAFGRDRSINIQKLGDASYNIYLGLRLPEHWGKTGASRLHAPDFRQRIVDAEYADWTPEITDLVRQSSGDFHVWPLYTLRSEEINWTPVKGVTLIGDAAHLGLPNGEGVNCAMFDALQLVEEIVSCGIGNLDEAVRKYEEKMLPRGRAHIDDGTEMQAKFHADDAPERFKAWIAEAMAAAGAE